MEAIIDYRGKTPKKASSGIPLVTAKIVKNGTILPYTEYIAEEDYDIWMQRGLPEPGDVVMTTEAPLGEVAQLDKTKVALAQRIITLRGKTDLLDNTFLRYLLTSRQVQYRLNARSSGTTVRGIKQSELRKIRLQFPSLPEQRRIAHILGSLDDKIALNRQQNATLEAMAQALFRSWFVDFDPVLDKALAAGHDIPEPLQAKAQRRLALGDQSKPLPPEVAGLFPDRFVYVEEVEWVPERWVFLETQKIADVVGGGTPSRKVDEYFTEDGIAWLSPKDLSGYEWKFISRGATDITSLGLAKSSAKLMPKGTVLFSSRAPIGYLAIAENEVTTNQGFKSLVPKEGIPSEFLFHLVKANIKRIYALASGSTFKEVSGSSLKSLKVVCPPIAILKAFEGFTKQGSKKQLVLQKEVICLSNLRNTLLPKLISGELRVPAAESLVEKGYDV